MLSVRGLGKSFGATRAVDDVTLDIPAGTFIGIIGRSGAGKSTLLRMINRLVDPSEGTISFGGADITALRGRDLRAWRARCAMVFQQFNLVDRLDVMTNVLLGRANNGVAALLKLWSADDKAIALTALEMFDMGRLAAQRAGTLSGGQQQRVAICRALVQEPDLILADEPVASLDPRSTRLVMDALRRVNVEFGITVLANLHSIDLARHYCDRLVGLSAGRLVFDGSPTELTDAAVRDLYGLESDEIADGQAAGARATHPAIDCIEAAH
ncbi:phosphonate ABC transporter ATP-binding protein [Falsiroseomonas sp.]|jgi:phosphonate transport system ATP-binding protein|uniref:phosphonate ABC transporter ATP-binding protein n=1 Tax=Falsiroseomonas sp. TaxID=2870721 RepID=UPI0034A5C4EB